MIDEMEEDEFYMSIQVESSTREYACSGIFNEQDSWAEPLSMMIAVLNSYGYVIQDRDIPIDNYGKVVV